MPLGLIGVKVGMTHVFNEKQEAAPVTVLKLGPCPVLQVRDADKDGYTALQLGYADKKRSRANRAERGHVAEDLESRRRKARKAAGIETPAKANCEPQKIMREFRLDTAGDHKVGQMLTVSEVFKDIKSVDVIGTTKGRGFTGVIKRHNFGGLRHSHGVKKGSRQRGSSASNASNRGSGRPKKGIKMAGQYGVERVTIRNLEVVKLDADNHLMLVRGAVPGFNGAVVMVRPTNKR
ncbi:MAG: 50S ribosomal protein L3 [Gemmataceae bacterium]